jgi:hypothetical protein
MTRRVVGLTTTICKTVSNKWCESNITYLFHPSSHTGRIYFSQIEVVILPASSQVELVVPKGLRLQPQR